VAVVLALTAGSTSVQAAGCAGRHDTVLLSADGLDLLSGLGALAEPEPDEDRSVPAKAPAAPCAGLRCSGNDSLPTSPVPTNIGGPGGDHWCLWSTATTVDRLLSYPRMPSEAMVKGLATGLSPLRPPR
jgi:hypothetical protein